jgi:hypothetical protein
MRCTMPARVRMSPTTTNASAANVTSFCIPSFRPVANAAKKPVPANRHDATKPTNIASAMLRLNTVFQMTITAMNVTRA